MVLWGSIVNAAVIIVGALTGAMLKFPATIKETIMNALALAVIIIGISMGLESENILIPIGALVLGSICGEMINLENKVERLGAKLENLTRKNTASTAGNFVQGFLTATLIYCVGAMAVIGSLNSGLRLEHQVLYAKSMLDGISAIFFSASLGIGVAFSALPVFVYQGAIALLATSIAPFLSAPVLHEITATGGILILGIGLNMFNLTKIAVGNMLPAILIAAILALVF